MLKRLIGRLFSSFFLFLWRYNSDSIRKIENEKFRRGFGYLHSSVVFHHPIHIDSKVNVYIDEDVNIAPFVQIWANDKVTIGKNTLIASHCIITTSTHDYKIKPIRSKRIDSPIVIGDDVWLGSGVIVFPGVKIGNGAVIGAGSVVMNDLESNSVYVGVPAKKIKDRFGLDSSFYGAEK